MKFSGKILFSIGSILALFFFASEAQALTCISCDTIGGTRVDGTSWGPTTRNECENALYTEFVTRGESSGYREGRIYQFGSEPVSDCTLRPLEEVTGPTYCPTNPTVTFSGTGEVGVVGESSGVYNVLAKVRVGSLDTSLCPLDTAGDFWLNMIDSLGAERGISSGHFEVGDELFLASSVSIEEVLSKLGKNLGDSTKTMIYVRFPGVPDYKIFETDLLLSAAAAGGPSAPPYQYEVTTPDISIPLPTLGGFTSLISSGEPGNRYLLIPWIGEYIAALYKYAIGITGILAGIMIVVAGLIWLTAGGDSGKVSTAKSYIESALVGLVIALTSYVLLYAVNPKLVGFEAMKVKFVERVEEPVASSAASLAEDLPAGALTSGNHSAFITPEQYKLATGKDMPSKDDIIAMMDEIAPAKGIDKCLLDAIVAKESGYKPNRLGHDEDVAREQVGSRRKFIDSGKKYSGATFAPNASLYTQSFPNDDVFDPQRPPNYGLDVRFTHGIGLGQMTILDEDHDGEMDRCPDGNIGREVGNTCLNALELFDAEKTLEASADLIKKKLQTVSGSVERLFYKYAGQGCSARVSQCKKMKVFAECKGDQNLAAKEREDCTSWLQEQDANCQNKDFR